MDNIDKLKLGEQNPQSLLFGEFKYDPDEYKYNFTNWTINTDAGHDIEVSLNKIIIKKFKPNTLIVKSTLLNAIPADVCSYMKDTKFVVKGLTYWKNKGLFSSSTSASTWYTVHSDPYYVQGLSFVPTYPDGRNYTGTFPWELKIADGYLKGANLGYKYFGYWDDCYTDLYNSPVTSFTTLYNSASGYQAGFFIYTNDTQFVNNDGLIDVSENPIVIMLCSTPGIDVTNIECWNAYMGEELVYHKGKTVANAWIKYGLAHMLGNTLVVDAASALEYGSYRLDLLDFVDYLPNVRFNCRPVNDDVCTLLINYLFDNQVSPEIVKCIGDQRETGMFCNSNTQDVELHLKDGTNTFMTMPCAFTNSDVRFIHLVIDNDCRISTTQRMFYRASKLTSIEYEGPACGATDCSGMFEGCTSLTTYPERLINWGQPGKHFVVDSNGSNEYYATNMGWFCDWCTKMITIPSAGAGLGNTIQIDKTCFAMFRGCSSLKTIGPVLDFSYVDPSAVVDADDTPRSAAYRCLECPNLETVKINHLNHADWYLNGKGPNHGNLKGLDNSSINYLVNNLSNLINVAAEDWHPTKPKNNSAKIYAPSTWSGKINSQAAAYATSVGWTIIID